jgi:hypothetical protein
MFTTLGLILGCLLLPYLISSVYSIISAVFRVSSPSTWLWGDWLGTVLGASHPLYMFLAEGPICCIGTIALLILIMGIVLMIAASGSGVDDYYEDDDNVYEPYEHDYGSDGDTEDWPAPTGQYPGLADRP